MQRHKHATEHLNKDLNESGLPEISDEVLFHPWFLPRRIQLAIRAMIPPAYHQKMRNLFDDYGCLRCERDSDYGSNGFCRDCASQIRARLLGSARRRLKGSRVSFDAALLRRQRLAKRLLRRFKVSRSVSTPSRLDPRSINPVDEALAGLPHRSDKM